MIRAFLFLSLFCTAAHAVEFHLEKSFDTGIKGLAYGQFSADGSLAVAHLPYAKALQVWDVQHGVRLREFSHGPFDQIDSALSALSRDGRIAATAFLSGRVAAWDIQSGKRIVNFSLPRDVKENVVSLALSGDGSWIAVVAGRSEQSQRDLLVISTRTGELVRTLAGVIDVIGGEFGFIVTRGFRYESNEAQFTLYADDFTEQRTFILRDAGYPEALIPSKDGKYAFVSNGGMGNLFDLSTETKLLDLKTLSSTWSPNSNWTRFSPEGSWVTLSGIGFPASVISTRDGKLIDLQASHPTAGTRCWAFSPRETLLVGGDLGGTIEAWNPGSASRLASTQARGECIEMAFSPDGQKLISFHSDGLIRTYRIQ